MGVLSWAGRIGRALLGRPDPQVQAERAWLGEQIKSYQIAYNRLSPFTENLTGETQAIRDAYRQMLKEPTVKAAITTKIFAVASLDLSVKPASRNQVDKDIADFNKDNIVKSRGGIRHVVESMLWGALLDGYSVSEKVKDIAQRGRWRGKIVLKRLKAKDAQNNRLQIVVDQFKNVTRVRANQANAGKEFNPNDFVVFTYLSLFENPLGMSDMRAVYRASTLKEAAIKLRMIFLDKFTGPYLVGHYAVDSVRTYLETALKQARQSGYITLPQGSDVQVVDLATRGTADFKSAIDDFDKEILMGLQAASLHMLEGQTPGGRGDTEVHKSTAELFTWYLASLVCDAINEQIIPDFTDMNFAGKPELPMATLGGVDAAEILQELAIYEKLHNIGVPLSLEEIYERAQRTLPKSPEDTLAGVPIGDQKQSAVPFEDSTPSIAVNGGEGSRAGTPFVPAPDLDAED